jgi:hypothetical protein
VDIAQHANEHYMQFTHVKHGRLYKESGNIVCASGLLSKQASLDLWVHSANNSLSKEGKHITALGPWAWWLW